MFANDFLVRMNGENIVVFERHVPTRVTKEQAIRLAAWIVALADPEEIEFTAALMEVQSS